MSKATAGPNGQNTFTLNELKVGRIYRDALSGYLVLVREVEVREYDRYAAGERYRQVQRTVGWMWNPVLGRHQEVELHDHQLINAEADTALMPDTRYKPGLHGV